jgi:hypothetical protein
MGNNPLDFGWSDGEVRENLANPQISGGGFDSLDCPKVYQGASHQYDAYAALFNGHSKVVATGRLLGIPGLGVHAENPFRPFLEVGLC